MTLPELLLYTEIKKSETTMMAALAKASMLGKLPIDHYLALARIRAACG